MIDQKELSKMVKGEELDHFLLLKKCEVKTGKTNREYLNMELGDNSVSLVANMWERFNDFYSTAEVGKIVKVKGLIDEYNGQSQIRVKEIRLSIPSDEVSPDSFLPRSTRDFHEMKSEFFNRIDRIEQPKLKELLILIFNEEAFNAYSRSPAGKGWHHAYLHGLLEHTLEMVRICDLMCDMHPEINRDILISGAFMHDYGKIEELSSDAVFDYTDKGKLIGHIVISAMELNEKISKIKNFPENLKTQLIHLVLSHQGKLEHASPVEPKTLEAVTLYHADELSAKTNAYKYAIKADDNGSNQWTRFLPLAGTTLYIPNAGEKNKG